jgi:hypothetical protein
MATTSTNKIPTMVDRHFLRAARLDSQVASYSNAQLNNVVQLLRVGDLPSQDGAIVEDLWIQNLSYGNYYPTVDYLPVLINLYVFIPDSSSPGSYSIFPIGQVEQSVTIGAHSSGMEITGVSSNVFTSLAPHNFNLGDLIQFSSSVVYNGVNYGQIYVVSSTPAGNTFSLKTLQGNNVVTPDSTAISRIVKVPSNPPKGSGKLGLASHVSLPWVMSPVPRFAAESPVATNKFQGLYLEKGHILACAIDTITGAIISAPGNTDRAGIGIVCQGGFF